VIYDPLQGDFQHFLNILQKPTLLGGTSKILKSRRLLEATMFNKILIPLDGSQLAERALRSGLQLAHRAEATLIILRSLEAQPQPVPAGYVLGGSSNLWPNQLEQLTREENTRYLESIRKQVTGTGLRVKIEIQEGEAAEAIVETAESLAADLIVMSSHGYSGLARWMLGSVAERVLHAAPCPVLMVRSSQPIRHMLIPLDGSGLSEQVLKAAFELAELMQCKVTLLRAIRPITTTEVEDLEKYERGFGKSFEEELHYTAAEYLTGILKADSHHLSETQTIVSHGPAAQSILDYAELHDVDVIAMSTHGRTGLQRWMYGSVTEKVLRGANVCSMLVVRPAAKQLAEA
jgi:nucleotide-binding universal stress UspA family protein